MDIYALPLESYKTTKPLQDYNYIWFTMESLCNQFTVKVLVIALRSFLNGRARGQSLKEFMNRFSKHDYVDNGNKQLLKKLIVNELNWQNLCRLSSRQCNWKGNKRCSKALLRCTSNVLKIYEYFTLYFVQYYRFVESFSCPYISGRKFQNKNITPSRISQQLRLMAQSRISQQVMVQ